MKKYLAWIGQNATTGTPHPQTGRLSMCGELIQFDTKVNRDDFVDNFHCTYNPSKIAAKTNKQEAKSKYFAGMTQWAFDDYLYYLGEPKHIDDY